MARSLTPIAVVLLVSANLLAQQGETAPQESAPQAPAQEGLPVAEATGKPVYSYAIGLEIGKNFKSDGVDLDLANLMAGIKDALSQSKPKFDEATCMKALQQLSIDKANAATMQSKQFLEENKKAEGVVSLPSGLQYKVLKAGTGATPDENDLVRTHYEGKLIDGTVFDSSYRNNEPVEFPVNGVIKGWTEALQKMKVGDKWQLFIPSELAYGDAGAGGMIPPGATLIFEVELLEVTPQE